MISLGQRRSGVCHGYSNRQHRIIPTHFRHTLTRLFMDVTLVHNTPHFYELFLAENSRFKGGVLTSSQKVQICHPFTKFLFYIWLLVYHRVQRTGLSAFHLVPNLARDLAAFEGIFNNIFTKTSALNQYKVESCNRFKDGLSLKINNLHIHLYLIATHYN